MIRRRRATETQYSATLIAARHQRLGSSTMAARAAAGVCGRGSAIIFTQWQTGSFFFDMALLPETVFFLNFDILLDVAQIWSGELHDQCCRSPRFDLTFFE